MTLAGQTNAVYSILVALLFALTAGLVGSFALMRRMLLAGDVISHLALPGFGLALLFKLNPLIGGAVTLFIGAIFIWNIQRKTGLATENVIGVVFATSLGIGAAVTPSEDLMEALFGGFERVSLYSCLLASLASVVVLVGVLRLKEELVLTLFSSDLAAATGVNTSRLNLYFLLLFSLTVLIGLRFMGALLAASLIILPAAIGRQLTSSMRSFLITSVVASALSVSIGLLLSISIFPKFDFGPMTVIVAAALFSASLFKRANTTS
jgi:ABC-type Mn2+/Zn2+ transport system permease subunit